MIQSDFGRRLPLLILCYMKSTNASITSARVTYVIVLMHVYSGREFFPEECLCHGELEQTIALEIRAIWRLSHFPAAIVHLA